MGKPVKMDSAQFLSKLEEMYGDPSKRKEVSYQEPKNIYEMDKSVKAGSRCYEYQGKLVMMSREDAKRLGLKEEPLYEGFKSYQAKRGKDNMSIGPYPKQKLGALIQKSGPPRKVIESGQDHFVIQHGNGFNPKIESSYEVSVPVDPPSPPVS